MKKVCLAKKDADDIKFLLRGQRHGEGANEIEINAKGVVVSDEDAQVLEDRLGMQVTITDVVAKDVAKEAADALKEADKVAKKAAKDAQDSQDAEKKEKDEADAKAKEEKEAAEAKAKADKEAADKK